MKTKRFKNLLIVGVICLIIGVVLFIIDMQTSNTNEALINSGALKGKSAQEVAQSFSANNQVNMGLSMLSKFLLGFGLAISLISGYKYFTMKNKNFN